MSLGFQPAFGFGTLRNGKAFSRSLRMVLCDREGRVYDVWITFGSVHEVRAFRERKKRSLWFRGLLENQGHICKTQKLPQSHPFFPKQRR